MSGIRRNQKTYVCLEIFNNEKPIKLVAHEDGAWEVLCGDVHPQDAAFCRVVGIGHLLDRDPTLYDVMDLPDHWEAERSEVGAPWIRTPSRPSE